MDAIRKGKAAQANIDIAKNTSEQEKNGGHSTEALRYLKDELRYLHDRNAAFDEAIRLTQLYYHLAPATPSGSVQRPKGPGENPGADWATGSPVKWSPRFYADPKIYFEIPGSGEKKHYGGEDVIDQDTGAMTLADGETIIMPSIFESAIRDNNPGDLAYLIHHEAFHFMELIHRGWDNRDEGEVRAYKDSLATLDIFELDSPPQCLDKMNGCWRRTFEEQIATHLASMRSLGKNLTPMYPTQEDSEGYKTSFVAFESNEGLIVSQIRELEPLAEAEQRRARDAAAAQSAKTTTKRAAAQCGFEESRVIAGGMSRFIGYKPTSASELHVYNFRSAKTMDQFKVILMLAQTCAAVTTGRTAYVDSPCNNGEGLDILKRHQDDPAFLNGIDATITVRAGYTGGNADPDQEYAYPCVADKLNELLRSTIDTKHYEALFTREAAINSNLNRTELADESRQADYWRQAENSSQEPVTRGRRSDLTPTKHCAASRGGVCVWWSN